MKKISIFVTAITALTGAASAGSFEISSPVVPVVIAAPASGWAGPYLGATFSTNSGTGDYIAPVSASLDNPLSGALYGGFAGYNIQRGSMVFGGEIAYQMGAVAFDWPIAPATAEVTNLLDLKGRVGFAAGKLHVYGVAGFTSGAYEEAAGGPATANASLSGFSYGAGAEFKMGEHMIVGLEYLKRDLSGPYELATGSVELNLDSVQLRVGWQF